MLLLISSAFALSLPESTFEELDDSSLELTGDNWFYRIKNVGNASVPVNLECDSDTTITIVSRNVSIGSGEFVTLADLPPGGSFSLRFWVGANEEKSCVILEHELPVYVVSGFGEITKQIFTLDKIIMIAAIGFFGAALILVGIVEREFLKKQKLGLLLFAFGVILLVIALVLIFAAESF